MMERKIESTLGAVLRSGSTLHLRPVQNSDLPELVAFFRRLPPGTPYWKLTARDLDAAALERFCNVDDANDFGLVGEAGGRIAAIAHYFRAPHQSERADVAFIVAEALRGQGIGTRLLGSLAEIARGHGISIFEADVLSEDPRMQGVFRRCGFRRTDRRVEGGIVRVRLDIAPASARQEEAAGRTEEAASASMKRLFEPSVVAVIGASRTRGKIGAEILHNLVSSGFRGTIAPINPAATELEGLRCYPQIADVPGPVDLAIIATPLVDDAIDECVAKGVHSVVVITAGFSETGDEGRRKEAALAAKIRAARIRMVGPNCMGLINTDPNVRLNATFGPVYPPEGRVALSSQSGALGLALLDYAAKLNLGISTFVSVGNKADVSSNDLIQYWAEDPRTDVILLYLESFGNPARFSQIARRVARKKPIVAVKSGRSRAGARAASSHTGALAESDQVVDALFRQAGVIRTTTLEELFDVAMLLAHQPLAQGRRVGILTNAGGPGILAADACEAQGLRLPPLTSKTVAALRSFLPAAASTGNPVDMLAAATPDQYRRAERALLADESIDSMLVIFIPPIAANPEATAQAILDGASGTQKPVLSIFMSAKGAPTVLAPIPCYPFPESAALALAHAVTYGEWRRRPPASPPALRGTDTQGARVIVGQALRRDGGWLTPPEAEGLLRAFGIPVVPMRLAADEAGTAAAARDLGFPVAVKAVGPTILHKTEAGGVRLGLQDEDAVADACHDLRKRLGENLTHFLVQPMVPDGVEMIVGVTHDATFGTLILYGSGGTLVELLGDVAFRLHPLADQDVAEMLEEVKGTALLRGYRGRPRLDEAALRDLLLRVSALVEACPEVLEMDLNPVKVLERGVQVIDARIRVGQPARLA